MANHERPYDIDVKFVLPKTKEEITYKMRTAIADLDANMERKSLDAKGQIVLKELWYSRLIDTVEGMDDATVRQLDKYTHSVLVNKWFEFNEPQTNFLEGMTKDELLSMISQLK